MDQLPLFPWRHFTGEIIVCGVQWYLRYTLSYRDVEDLLRERGGSVDHTPVFRWVQRYAPALDKECRHHLPALAYFRASASSLFFQKEYSRP